LIASKWAGDQTAISALPYHTGRENIRAVRNIRRFRVNNQSTRLTDLSVNEKSFEGNPQVIDVVVWFNNGRYYATIQPCNIPPSGNGFSCRQYEHMIYAKRITLETGVKRFSAKRLAEYAGDFPKHAQYKPLIEAVCAQYGLTLVTPLV